MNNMLPEENKVSLEESDEMTASFEQAIALGDLQHYYLRLYIAGTTPRSMQSLKNLKLLCETYLQGRYELEVIDVYQSSPELQVDNVVAIPTLVKHLPLPLRQIIGDLSDTEKVLLGLNIVPR
ncbi:MAG: thiol-disulfide isomerase [Nostoc sp. NMS7]|uniref:circadian clock KaiB family protein n=1 Tax=unclassified Nostoc TaxID=2593658 RepID=UPI0025DFD915|nr:circadian clock KaiB family protein [Nostoc sp. NMS7]MBN3945003.1 thiol-disulfide isomerase [Nostoc sp. NMS7]